MVDDHEQGAFSIRALRELAEVEHDSLFDEEGNLRANPEYRCKYCHHINDNEATQLYLSCERCLKEGCTHCLPVCVPNFSTYMYLCMNCHIVVEEKIAATLVEESGVPFGDDLFKDGDEPPALIEDSDEEPFVAGNWSEDSDDELEQPVDHQLIEQLVEAAPVKQFLMPLPWESGWLSTVMGSSSSSDFIPVPMEVPIQRTKPALQVGMAPVPTVIRASIYKKRRVEFHKEIRQERQAAIKLCLSILQTVPGSSRVSRQIANLSEEAAMQIVADTVQDRASGTIRSRSYSLAQFVRWKKLKCDEPPFPVSEVDAYEYVSFLRHTGAPATRGTRFRQALAFGKHVLGLGMDEETLSSRRVAGAALALFSTKRLLKQRSPLTVKMVTMLEQLIAMSEDLQEVVFVGHCLFALHVRCRFSDMMNVTVEPTVDGPYVESATHTHKTSNVKGRRNKWLPLAGLSCGVTDSPWAETWLRARAKSGLQAEELKPFLPAPLSDGSWGVGKLTIGEATLWLTEILVRLGVGRESLVDLGTHSLKTTLLSWAAKAGLDHETRRTLGGHISKADGSMMAYSRDGIAGPLLKLEMLVSQVRSGLFDPDKNRAGRWNDAYVEPEEAEVEVSDEGILLKPKAKIKPAPSIIWDEVGQSDVSSSSGSEERDESSGEESFEKAANVVTKLASTGAEVKASEWRRRAAASDVDPDVVYRHVLRSTYHLGKLSDDMRLGCGRLRSDKYRFCSEVPDVLWPRCASCFGSEHIQNAECVAIDDEHEAEF